MTGAEGSRRGGGAVDREGTVRRRSAGDEGSTLLEVVIGMSIMSIFLAMFTGAIVVLTQTQNRAEALTTSSGDVNTAFQRLDSTIRYAAAISPPGSTGSAGGWYVEFLTTASGTAVCTQLRVDSTLQQLQSRTWQPDAPSTAPTRWVPLANHITNGNATTGSADVPVPFTLFPAPDGVGFEQLTVRLAATTGNPAMISRSAMTFTALNSADASKAAGDPSATPTATCAQGRP